MSDMDARLRGHEEYRSWIAAVGECFSPLCPCKEPLRFGAWASWTVEGLYQGLKLHVIEDCSRIHPSVDFEVFLQGKPAVIHCPSIMDVKGDLRCHFWFKLLKSGRKYNSKRNRYFGVIDRRERNWRFTESWRHPVENVAVSRDQFSKEVFVPAFHLQLSQFRAEVSVLRSLWRSGRHEITPNMRHAHGHLKYLVDYVNTFG